MISSKKTLFAVLTLGLAVLLPVFAHAEVLDPARLSIIQEHCTVLQTSLDQVQRRDLVARTNRGREYESTLAQLTAFNQRLQNNGRPVKTLDDTLNNFKTMVDDFRTNYIAYDNSMNDLRQIDCRNHPADFALALQRTAILRAQVGAEVTKGEEYLGVYRQTVVEMQKSLGQGSGQ
ncbi:MAG TPA: hypothetical protein VLA88_01540 [Candidatus Saccharimonadales bacterium]|nr:hypothetical protein [Candidatus Saccharimonadales bacterium]